jgi:hypothetical protein
VSPGSDPAICATVLNNRTSSQSSQAAGRSRIYWTSGPAIALVLLFEDTLAPGNAAQSLTCKMLLQGLSTTLVVARAIVGPKSVVAATRRLPLDTARA